MKANVDLTENRDFLTTSLKSSYVGNYVINFNSPYFDYLFDRFHVPNDSYYIGHDNGYVYQGNYEERIAKKISSEFNLGRYCDCCGIELKPYYHDCLCLKCSARFDNHINL